MEEDNASTAAVTTATAPISNLPEVELYMYLLVLMFLLDRQQHTQVGACRKELEWCLCIKRQQMHHGVQGSRTGLLHDKASRCRRTAYCILTCTASWT